MAPRFRILAVACGLVLACGTNPDVFHIGCGDMDVTLQVGSGLTPQIGWSPDCEVGAVTVLEYAAADTAAEGTALDVAWRIRSPGNDEGPNNLLSPSVRYGQVSAGAIVDTPPKALVAGTPYRVFLSVYRLGSVTPSEVASAVFRP